MDITINSINGVNTAKRNTNLKKQGNTSYPVQIKVNKLQNDVFERNNGAVNPSFGASFWKTMAVAISGGAAAGSAVGAKIGGTVDISTGLVSGGTITASSTAVGGAIGGISGFFTGLWKYFSDSDKDTEIKKREKKIKDMEDEIERYKRKKAAQEAINESMGAETAKTDKKYDEMMTKINNNLKIEKKRILELTDSGLKRVAGYDEDKKALMGIVVSPFVQSLDPVTGAAFASKVPNGVLLYGLSGNGKTRMAQALIEELIGQAKVRGTDVNFEDLSQEKQSRLEDKLDFIQHQAAADFEENNKRTIVFMDEFDRFANIKTKNTKGAMLNEKVKEFISNASKNGITVIATTNYPQNIYRPILEDDDVFSLKTIIEPPSKEDIKEIFKYYLDGTTTGEINYKKLAEKLEKKAKEWDGKYNCSSIEDMSNKAKASAQEDKRLVTQEDIETLIDNSKPDLTRRYMDLFKTDFKFISGGMSYEEYSRQKEAEKGVK